MNLLIVCTGNTCRSPFAQAYFNKKAADLSLDLRARSAGLFVFAPSAPCYEALEAAKSFGVDAEMKLHRSKNITEDELLWADTVFAVTMNHYEVLYPKVELLNSVRTDGKETKLYCLGNGIDDPYGGSYEDYLSCYRTISECCDLVLKQIIEENKGDES